MAIRDITTPQTLLGLDAGMRTAMAGLKEIMVDSEKNIEDFVSQMFTSATFDDKKMTKAVYGGMGLGSQWDQKSDKIMVSAEYLHDISVEQYAWASAFAITDEQQTWDDRFKLNAKFAKEFIVSLANTRQYAAMAFWNNAFTASAVCQWYNSTTKALFSATHAYGNNATNSIAGTTTWSNLGTGAGSLSAYTDAMNKLFNQRDWEGRPAKQMPKVLWVYPTKIGETKQILGIGQGKQSGEVSNNANMFGSNIYGDVVVKGNPYFDNVNKWILMGNDVQVYVSEKIPLTTKTLPITTTAGTLVTEGKFSLATWAESPRGMVGYAG